MIINIALSTDNQYVDYTATVMYSVLSKIAPDSVCHFFVLSTELSLFSRQKLYALRKRKSCEITFLTFPETLLSIFKPIKLPKHISLACYSRLLLPKILPYLERILYLDSDIVVLKDITPLYCSDLGENYFGAVEDVDLSHRATLGYSSKYTYFNSGVLLFDIKKLNAIDYYTILEKSITEHKEHYPIGGDQDILNDSFFDKIQQVSYRWNMFHKWHPINIFFVPTMREDYIESINDPHIIHFVGPKKPWHSKCKHPCAKYFLRFYKQYQHLLPWYLKVFQRIFSVKKSETHKIISIFGIRISLRNFKIKE